MNHTDIVTLTDYWLATLDTDAESELEEHLFGCAVCTEALQWVARFTKGVREVVRRGNLAIVLAPEFLARLSAEGLRVRSYAPLAGGSVQCTVTSQDDLLVGRLQTDLSAVTRLDVLLCGPAGEVHARFEDVPFRPAANSEILFNQPMDAARQMGAQVLVVQLVAVEDGQESALASYTFNHSPSPQ